MHTQTLIIGAGIAGLITAKELAKTQKHVLVMDANRHAGGRAVSHQRNGLIVNQGPHALYLKGHLHQWLRQNNHSVPFTIPGNNTSLDWSGQHHKIPQRPDEIWRASWLKGGRWEAAQTLLKMLTASASALHQLSAEQWVARQCQHEATRAFIKMLLRLTSYTGQLETLNARDALRQFQLGARGVGYIHHGWQTIVDNLTQQLEHTPSIEVRCGQGIVSVERHNSAWHALPRRGETIVAQNIVMAMSPHKAIELIQHPCAAAIAAQLGKQPPSIVATLDLLMRDGANAPQLVLGTQTPFYFSNVTRTTPMSKAPTSRQLWQMVHYSPHTCADPRQTLTHWLDQTIPNWREHCEDMIYRPKMQTSTALVPPNETPIPTRWFSGLYCASDGTGARGMLADRSVASALEIVDHLTHHARHYHHAS